MARDDSGALCVSPLHEGNQVEVFKQGLPHQLIVPSQPIVTSLWNIGQPS